MLIRLKNFSKVAIRSLRLLRKNSPLILSSSTAFFTTFSLSPIIIILVSAFSIYFKSDKITRQLFGKIGSTFGEEPARELEGIVHNFMKVESNVWTTAAGIVFFLFVATTLLGVVKENLHKLWSIRGRPRRIRYVMKERSIQAGIILFTGVLFLVSVLMDTALSISLDYLSIVIPQMGIFIIRFFNFIFSLIIVTLWFMLIFKLLPDARVQWDIAFNGAFITAILFTTGKLLLGKILVHARVASIFGASASFALLLLFIFYCSFILYFGAAFTHEYSEHADKHICAIKHAHEYEEKVIEAPANGRK